MKATNLAVRIDDAPDDEAIAQAATPAPKSVPTSAPEPAPERAEPSEADAAAFQGDRRGLPGAANPVHAAQDRIEASFAAEDKRSGATYLRAAAAVLVAGVVGLWHANVQFAPTLYERATAETIARAFDNGRNYGVFDLNLDIRNIRDAHIARMDETPDAVVLGASHWQEAHAEIVDDRNFYNAHVHRDYYEDMLAVTEMFVRHDRLPETMIITIRDNLMTPVAERTDFLWLPGIPYYRAMAERLGLRAHHPVETLPVVNWKDKLSLRHLRDNAVRWFNAEERPHATDRKHFQSLDTLLPGGSILWSGDHLNVFTPQRAREEALAFAAAKADNPPQIDPKGVEALEALFLFLKDQGVTVYLAHPPFNPLFWDAVQGTPYREGLKDIEALTKDFAERHGFGMVGSFDPYEIGTCPSKIYIDAEHAGPSCLGGVYKQFMAAERARLAAASGDVPTALLRTASAPAPKPVRVITPN